MLPPAWPRALSGKQRGATGQVLTESYLLGWAAFAHRNLSTGTHGQVAEDVCVRSAIGVSQMSSESGFVAKAAPAEHRAPREAPGAQAVSPLPL